MRRSMFCGIFCAASVVSRKFVELFPLHEFTATTRVIPSEVEGSAFQFLSRMKT